jgi:hypothetical protein
MAPLRHLYLPIFRHLFVIAMAFFLSLIILFELSSFTHPNIETTLAPSLANDSVHEVEERPSDPPDAIDGLHGYEIGADGYPASSEPNTARKPQQSAVPPRMKEHLKNSFPNRTIDGQAPTTAVVPPVTAVTSNPKVNSPTKEPSSDSDEETISIEKRVENGRVVEAHVSNHRAGMDALENSALRIIRMRHYPAYVAGAEAERIKIKKQ